MHEMKTLHLIIFASIIIASLFLGGIQKTAAGERRENETTTESATITLTWRTSGEPGEIVKSTTTCSNQEKL